QYVMTAPIPIVDGVSASVRAMDRIRRLRWLARLLDSSIGVPGTRWRIGLDPLLGLIPVVGDIVPLVFSLWIVLESHRLGASRSTTARMLANALIDFGIGEVPVIGDLFDFAWKANIRNLALLEQEFGLAPSDLQTRG